MSWLSFHSLLCRLAGRRLPFVIVLNLGTIEQRTALAARYGAPIAGTD
jgi:hypothetical protein